eukprot:2038483-Rhodomonas_salina.6
MSPASTFDDTCSCNRPDQYPAQISTPPRSVPRPDQYPALYRPDRYQRSTEHAAQHHTRAQYRTLA